MNPTVATVHAVAPHRLRVRFSNGEVRLFDVSPLLHLGVFRQLRDAARFQAVRAVAGSVEWPGGIDLSYDTLYVDGVPEVLTPSVDR